MKGKIPVIVTVAAALLSCGAPASFAATGATVDAASRIVLTESQTVFDVPISIGYAEAFAGVEIAVQCGDGVAVKSVSYSKDVSHAGPTEARGLIWFTTFSGSNDYTEGLTATIHASYSGRGNTSLVIDHAAFHTVDKNTFRTENVPLRKTVTISREGADNIPPALTPPTTETESAPGSGNPPSGDAVNAPEKTVQKKSGKKSTGGTNNKDSTNTNPGTGGANAADTSSATPVIANAGNAAQNEQITSGDIGRQVPISSSEVPLAGGNANTTTREGGAKALNMATLIMALACLAGVIFLGFLFIKRKRDEKKLREERLVKEEELKEVS